MVAMVITVIMSVLLSGNIAKDAKVAVIDLDNSAYSRELINHIEASEFMKVTAVLNTPQDPKELFYQDRAVAVVYFPPGLEKARYTGEAANLGVFYDNTSSAATSNIKEALNEIVGLDNAVANGDVGSSNDSLQGQLSLASRNLFNPQDSKDNGETLGFLLFFGAMFFTFATIGSVANHMELFDDFNAILVDEAHNVNAAGGQYKDFFEKVPRKVLGLTATPYRLYTSQGIEVDGVYKPNGSFKEEDYYGDDLRPIAGVREVNKCILKFLTRTRPRVFSKVLYSIGIDTLLQQGYLARLRYFNMPVVNPNNIRRNSTGRDYDERSLSAEFSRVSLSARLAEIVSRLMHPKDGIPRKGILVFTRFITESEALCHAVPGCAMLTGDTPADERTRIITDFKAGKIKALTNVGVLTTGFDYPELDTIVMACPTMSLARWYQCIGRAIRPSPGKRGWVVDLGGNYDRFGEVENLRLFENKPGEWAIHGWVHNQWTQLTNVYF